MVVVALVGLIVVAGNRSTPSQQLTAASTGPSTTSVASTSSSSQPSTTSSSTSTTTSTTVTTTTQPVEPSESTERPDIGISISLPSAWSNTPGEDQSAAIVRDGETGFISLAPGHTASSGSSDQLANACDAEANHVLRPYGSSPTTTFGEIDGHRACFVSPSDDAPTSARRQGGLAFATAVAIVDYATPVAGSDGEQHVDVIIYCDPSHLGSLTASVSFLGGH